MEAFGVEQEIRSTLSRRVDLPSGGYLIFDYAEAFTVIDVNTGRFVGSRSKKSGARLEDTITKNNLEAVKEVVRQLRLRDIGGIIVIDFIDMASPKNRAAVEEALGAELERDRTKTYVVEISPLGLVEMTRQNVTDGPREVMTKKCPTCGGDGIVVSEHTAAVDIERRLRMLVDARLAREGVQGRGRRRRSRASSSAPAARACASSRRRRSAASSSSARTDVHLDHFRVLEQGTLEKVAPEAAGRGRPGARAEARRGRPVRRARRRRQGRRHRRSSSAMRPSSSARRSRCASPPSPRASPGPSCSRRSTRRRRAADRRGRGREADARQAPGVAEEDATTRRARRRRARGWTSSTDDDDRGDVEDDEASCRRGRRRSRRRDRRSAGRDDDAGEEAHAPRLARRPQPQEGRRPARTGGEPLPRTAASRPSPPSAELDRPSSMPPASRTTRRSRSRRDPPLLADASSSAPPAR